MSGLQLMVTLVNGDHTTVVTSIVASQQQSDKRQMFFYVKIDWSSNNPFNWNLHGLLFLERVLMKQVTFKVYVTTFFHRKYCHIIDIKTKRVNFLYVSLIT